MQTDETVKKTSNVFIFAIIAIFISSGVCFCDTFTNNQTREELHGYFQNKMEGSLTYVVTQERGTVKLNLNEWSITRDRKGRSNKVIVLPVDDIIKLELETNVFEQALGADSNEGPLLILVEIDTPGGRVDLAHQMCSAITRLNNCDVIAYVKGGQYGGAISAGSAVAFACNNIYMANGTVIGAATLVDPTRKSQDTNSYKDVVDEKHSSAWRAYLASLAEKNNRPGLMARAMVDRNIEIVEVNRGGIKDFIEPVNKIADQKVIKTWNKQGSLLTLTAQEAVECNIADGIVNSQQELLKRLQLSDANVIVDKKIASARREFDLVQKQLEVIKKSLDMKVKQSKNPQTQGKALAILRGAKSDFEMLISMGKKYPDLNFDVTQLNEELNSINAEIEKINAEARKHR